MWFRKRDNEIEMEGMRPERERKEEEELIETDYQPFNWKKFFLSPKYIPWHILAILIAVATVMITIRHDQVVEKLRPFSEKVRDLPAGWLIPIAILIIISFPPLFGHEIIAVLCGVVYGLWIGFAIVAAGTFIGEIGTWFAFKYAFRRKAYKLERTNLNYGAMARLTRDGGFVIVLIIRLSAIPAHFSTAVFSTCNVKFWHFVVATFASLPKQIFLVYLGVLLLEQGNDNVIKTVMFTAVFLVTAAMGIWIYMKMRKVKKVLLEEQEIRRTKRAEGVQMVPSVKDAFERPDVSEMRYDERPNVSEGRYDERQDVSGRRYDEEAGEWMMAPTQPTRIV
ncbi:Tlg2-vesicle protein [Neocucurbitaria cava]|uniref:Golgi apparatus membrane protein TVP38 n=1 Tax=Neocucurbitaria cava TaxID=798079 RepID=A0A9W8Y177_9PLEO|nr:Tlg2-vesicle protein [Neocucurbitaria cava]